MVGSGLSGLQKRCEAKAAGRHVEEQGGCLAGEARFGQFGRRNALLFKQGEVGGHLSLRCLDNFPVQHAADVGKALGFGHCHALQPDGAAPSAQVAETRREPLELARRIGRVFQFGKFGLEHLDRRRQRCAKQLVLAAEMGVDRPLRCGRTRGHLVHRRVRETALHKRLDRRAQDRLGQG